ncbi:hypothetical protein SK128_005859 [Halocaridina rubra]|uniref:Uncharacterized protein n=1 Tax=Halocaridina rubra TaxID=373956 RepID=A0AAN8XCQ7_HALRR
MESEDDHHRQQNSSPRISKGERKDVTKRESVECDKCEKQMNTFEKELNLSAKKSCTDTLDPEENVHLQIIQPLLNVNTTENINSPSNESSVKEGKKEEETVLVPPDGGWGWLVAIGAFIITMLLPSVGPCFGILFSGFLLENDVSSTTTSWIFNIQMMFWHLMGPAVHPLTLEFGWRKVGAFGIILTASAVTVSAFIPSPAFLFFSFSFISGIGNGLAITMSVIIVPQYFDKKRGLSNSILMSGISFGQITSAPLARYLLDVYGFKGAALIFGAVLLHGLIGVSFFQPVEWHMKRKTVARREPEILASSCIEKDDETCNENLHLHHKTNDSIANNHSSNDAHGSTELTKDAKGKRSCKSAVVLIDIIIRVARSTISDIKIVRMLRVRICCGALALCIIGYMNYLMQIPFAMQAADFSLQEASWCISVFGMSNMVTRLVLSALSDLPKFDLRLFLMIGYFLAAVSMFGRCKKLYNIRWLQIPG